MEQVFAPLPPVPDHPRLEEEILQWWEDEQVFQQLRDKNHGGPKFSFMDGPITANAPAGVHHGLGRTLKDVFQRYKALRGHDLRYQNGFDSQGLHVEVQVEKGLGLNSKREIEEYGIGEFARRCREFVAHFAGIQTEQSKRLGMWMDWENSYFTFSDTNIEYIWRFLKNVHDRGWLYMGHRSTQWCPRCGTSLSKHEQAGDENYEELEHPSLFVRFPLVEREGEALVIWTTTPWTLPANVAAAVKPDAQYGRSENGDWVSVDVFPDGDYVERLRGEDLVGLHYRAPFDDYPAQEGVEHRVIPWDDVALDEGTGIVHIAPGAGAEDFELSRLHGLAVLAPIDESGRFLPGYGEFEGRTTDAVAEPVLEWLHEHELLVEAGTIRHRYPVCWRCRTPLVFRVVDDWFISAAEIRQLMLDGNDEVAWQPPQYKKRMDDWLRNMGDWNISRRRYFGLPLPFYPCDCGRLNVIGSRAELDERAVSGLDQLEELHRPWIDEVTIRCEDCGAEVTRIEEVGDAWLDAGIVHFSTLGWQNPEWVPEGNATGAARGVTHADLPDHAYWEKWFPADWVSEGRAQIRLWFYSQCFMAMALVGRQPYQSVLTYENLLDETGREMHKSWGNAIELNEALDRMGADVMRWLYCEQNPSQELRFGTYVGVRERGDGELRALLDARRHRRVRALRRRSVELVHPAVATTVLGRRRDRATCAVGGPANVAPGDRAGDAVPRRAALAEPRAEGEVGFPRGLAGARRDRRNAERGGGGGTAGRGARPAGARGIEVEAPAAAPPGRRRRRGRRALACGRDRRRATREAGRVRRRRGERAPREAEPASARP